MLTIQNLDKIAEYTVSNGDWIYCIDDIISDGHTYVLTIAYNGDSIATKFVIDRATMDLSVSSRHKKLTKACLHSPVALLTTCFHLALEPG